MAIAETAETAETRRSLPAALKRRDLLRAAGACALAGPALAVHGAAPPRRLHPGWSGAA